MAVGDRNAVILNNFAHWHKVNMADERHCKDGHVWLWNSIAEFAGLWPYLTERQIRTALEGLESDGYLRTGKYATKKTDHTKWYALTEKACTLLGISFIPDLTEKSIRVDKKVKSNLQESQIELTEKSNGFDTEVKTYTDTNPIENSIENSSLSPSIGAEAPTEQAPEFIDAVVVADEKKPTRHRPPATKGVVINIAFSDWYNAYDKKRDAGLCETEWGRLTDEERWQAMQHTPHYTAANPKQFRKDPIRYLKNKSWNDEIISRHEPAPIYANNNRRNGHQYSSTAEFGAELDRVFAAASGYDDSEKPF